MQQSTSATLPADSPATDAETVPAWTGPVRIGIGLAQGLLLYLLYSAAQDKAWPASAPLLFAPLVMLGLLLPVIVISGLGQMRGRALLRWALAAGAVIALLAVYDIWRRTGVLDELSGKPSGVLACSLGAGFFIAHALVLAGSRAHRRIAPYADYFESAWKLKLQLLFCSLFVGTVWLALVLGAALFGLVKLEFLQDIISEPWFGIPVTAFAFAAALHLTDVKPSIVRGIRNLLLLLLSWVLPVATLLVGGFLASLPGTGLEPLWATRSAAALMLSAAALLVLLINAAYQDGAAVPTPVVAIAARIASLLLVPLTLLAAHALLLRVNEYGWSSDRVIAAAGLLVAACYAGGYAAAALRRGWLRTLAGVNVAAAFVVLAVLVLLLSPILDPGRIAVDSQMARLAAGKVKLPQLDVAYLYHHGARYGRAALAHLERTATGLDADWLKVELARLRHPQELDTGAAANTLARNLRVWPAGAALPAGFDWKQVKEQFRLPLCLRTENAVCDAFVLDLGGDARPEVVLVGAPNHGNAVLRQGAGDAWELAGILPPELNGCTPLLDAMRAGKLRAIPSRMHDLEVAGQRIAIDATSTELDCKAAPATAPASPGAANEKDAPR